jgi:hypothetical protein
MPVKGRVRVVTCRQDARAVADWLTYLLTKSALFSDYDSLHQYGRRFVDTLRKASVRRRTSAHFTILLDREIAAWFANKRPAIAIAKCGIPEAYRLMEACGKVRGRPKLSQIEAEKRERQEFSVEERHQRRIALRARDDRALRAWLTAGNSLLGAAGTPREWVAPRKK